MECCEISTKIDIQKGTEKIVIAGNPNVGKSIFFNYLTNSYVDVSNYPGTTLDISSGKFEDKAVLDTPGVYGVSSFNDEERVARDVILSANLVINVVDAVHLDRDLFLTQQIIDMGIPVIVALNMMDEAEDKNISIDIDRLSKELGVPVIPTIAVKGDGLDSLKKSLGQACTGNSALSNEMEDKLDALQGYNSRRRENLLFLEGDKNIIREYDIDESNYQEKIYQHRRNRIDSLIQQVYKREGEENSFSEKLGRWMLKPLTGIPLLLGILYLLYQFIGVFVAQTVVGFTEKTIFIHNYEPFIRGLIAQLVPLESLMGQLLVGEFGVFTMAITYTLGLLLPLVFGFYLFLSLLEDSGLLPRIAALVDRMLTAVGLNGRAIIPMILGFGCVTMATITTRLLGSKRERFIAIVLLGLTIPCSAQLGVIVGLIAPLGANFLLLYVATILVVYILSGTILNKILPGESTDLLIDLPPIRTPGFKNVLRKSYIKSKLFILEAGPIFIIGAIAVTLMQYFGILNWLQEGLAPLTTGWLELPKEAATAFIMGIVRRDFGAAGLTQLAMTPLQTTVSLITITLFVPCIAAMMILIKERNWKEATGIWLGSWVVAILVGGIVTKLF